MRVHEVIITQELHPLILQTIAHRASQYQSEIMLKIEDKQLQLDAKSLLGLLMLGLPIGTRVRIQTKGKDEEEAIEMMCLLLDNKA